MRYRLLLVAAAALAGAARASPDSAEATFQARHELVVKVPQGSKSVRVWFTEPQKDPAQTVADLKVESPVSPREVTDADGNTFLFFETSQAGDFKVVTTFRVTRREVRGATDPAATRPYTAEDLKGKERWLAAAQFVPIDDGMRGRAREIVGEERNPIRMSRRIYDWVLNHAQYWVKDPANLKASATGDALYCLEKCTGNCTDFHSLYLALSRAAGIPTQIVYGSFFKAPLDGVDQDQSYHCWIEFWAPEAGWIPLDVAVADLYVDDFRLDETNAPKVRLTTADGYRGPDPKMVDWYFGNIDNRRVVWSRGRDLTLDPKQAGGPVNAVAKAHVEIDGKASTDYVRTLTYRKVS